MPEFGFVLLVLVVLAVAIALNYRWPRRDPDQHVTAAKARQKGAL